MVIVRMFGGLGNQMFIYAYVRSLQEKGIDAKIDLSWLEKHKKDGPGYILPKVFPNIRSVFATPKECSQLAIYQLDYFHRIWRKIFGNKKTYIMQERRFHDVGYNEELANIGTAYIEGYFQSERYFKDIESVIRKDFAFELPDGYDDTYLKEIQACNSVSLHIRRGDYVTNGNKLLCNTDYYRYAIDYFEKHVDEPVFFVFSDDITWCEKYFSKLKGRFVFVKGQEHAWQDMYLMSRCQHNIIADSSFSWWGAWLNEHKEKIVYCPEKWFASNDLKITGIHSEGWVKGRIQ